MTLAKFRTTGVSTLALVLLAGSVRAPGLRAEPKNVIILIGDGMGPEQVKAAGIYENGAAGTLSFEALPRQGRVITLSAGGAVTDSAAAATAIATGVKVNNGVISVASPGDGSELETLLEYFRDGGKSTGLVTTAFMTDATPAAFAAHEPSRADVGEIAADYLNQTRPNVLLGGGGNGLTPQDATAAGYTVVTDRAGMLGLDTEAESMVSGQFGGGDFPYEYDGLGVLPHLSEMTATALAILDNDPDGFFLMVEGGLIDHACHANDLERSIAELVEFNSAVELALEWTLGREDTLVIVTADHETGGLGVVTNNGQGVYPTVTWSGGNHTGTNVPVYARGPGAERLFGVIDNTDISGVVIASSVALVSPPAQGVIDSTVTFLCRARDDAGLSGAELYLGTAAQALTFSGAAETEDAQIDADSPDTNYGDNTWISINVDGFTPHAHAVMKFPGLIGFGSGQLPPGTRVGSATLAVNCTNQGNLMQMYRLTEDWVESEVTWNERASGLPWPDPGADGSGSHAATALGADCTQTGLRSFDVTSFVQDWADGFPNYGILLVDTGTDGVDFDSSESAHPPVLTVTLQTDWQPVESVALSGTSALVSFNPRTLEDQKEYLWNCLVTSATGQQSWASSDSNFRVDTATDFPRQPVLSSPQDGAGGLSLAPALEVLVSDPQGDPLTVTFYGRGGRAEEEFSVVALPDTQYYSSSFPQIFTDQTQWIASNVSERDIAFVTHEGDLVQNYDQVEQEWVQASASMSLLDGLVPYGMAPGNHDLPTTLFNLYFPYTRYSSESWYGGHYPLDGNDNSYQLFSVGGDDFIVLHLVYSPDATVLDWADSVLKAHRNRKAIVTTHSYLNTDGSRTAEGATVWNDLIRTSDNVYLVLCGHVSGEGRRTDVVNGREVHQILADYQSRANGGDGWLRLLRFAPAQGLVHVESYSPTLDRYETDDSSQFTLSLPMTGFSMIGSEADVPSGSTVSMPWPELELGTGYEWFVRITDPDGNTQNGPVWKFRTGTEDSTPPVISAVSAVEISDTSATITWTTDEAADSVVDYGPDSSYGSSVSDGALVTAHSLTLTGLAEATSYHFRVSSTDSSGNLSTGDDETFVTELRPLAADDSYSVDEDSVLVVPAPGVLANDSDDDPLTVILTADPSSGTLSLGADGSFVYTPYADFNGTDSFSYVASDGAALSDPAAVTITVTPVNDPPLALDDAYTGMQDTELLVSAPGVLENDLDRDGDPLMAVLATEPSSGSLTLDPDGSFVYDPAPGFFGDDSFTYIALDASDASGPAVVTITMMRFNHEPVAVDDSYATDEDTTLLVNAPGVLANDTDADGDSLTASPVSLPANGVLGLSADGGFTYTPDADFHGQDNFTYTADDGQGGSSTADVTVTISPVNDPPEAPRNLIASAGDRSVTLAWDASLDVDGNLAGYNIYRAPSSGAYDFETPLAFVAVPETSYLDTGLQNDTSYFYVVRAVDSASLESGPSNEASATPSNTIYDAYATQDPIITFGILGGDGPVGTTVSGDGLVQTISEAPNGRAGSSSLQAEYTLQTTANPAAITSLEVHLEAGWTAGDPDDPLVVSIWDGAGWQNITSEIADGTFVAGASPQSYVGSGGDIRILFEDTAPISKETKDTLSIDLLYAHVGVGPENEAPVATDDVYVTDEDAGLAVPAATGTLANDTDAEGDPLTANLVAGPGGGVLVLNADGSFTYSPAADFNGIDVFTYRASDGGSESNTATVTIVVNPVEDLPLAFDDSYAVEQNSTLTVPAPGVLGNDADPDGDLLAAEPVASPASGNLTLNADGSFTYIPNADFTGDDSFTYRCSDGSNESAIATVTISVRPPGGQYTHVQSIDLELQQTGKKTKARATVIIAPALENATVSGNWYLDGALIDSNSTGLTDGAGAVVLSTSPQQVSSGDRFTFEVSDIVLDGYTYDPLQDVESSDFIDVP